MNYQWKYSASYVKSPRHEVCQDSVYVRRSEKGNRHFMAAVLSDGAGSASKSEYGSKALVEKISEHVISFFDSLYAELNENVDGFKNDIVDMAVEILEKTATEQSCAVKDLSSTLMFIASDSKNTMFFHVGDGVILFREDSHFTVVSKPFNGEYANETVFVNSRDAVVSAHAGIIPVSGSISYFLMSDGPEPVFYSKKTSEASSIQLLSFVDDKLNEMKDINNRNNFLEYVLSERCRPYSADDLSLIIIKGRKLPAKNKRTFNRAKGINRHTGKKKAK